MKKVILLFTISLITFQGMSQETVNSTSFNPNFVHTVFFWLNNPDSADDRAAFEDALKQLLKDSKYTKTNYIGTAPKAIRDVVDDSFTYKLIVTFESNEEQELYQGEEAHLKFIEDANHLWKKVVVYDAVELED